MEYADFYDIAEYGNKHWKGKFSPKEIACNAYDYLLEFETSNKQGKPTFCIKELCKLLIEDIKNSSESEEACEFLEKICDNVTWK